MSGKATRVILIATIAAIFFAISYAKLTDHSKQLKDPSAQSSKSAPTASANSSADKSEDSVWKDDYTFIDTQGRSYKSQEMRGKVVMVVFWATWCPPCRSEIPTLNEIQEKYAQRGAMVLAISQDDELKDLKNFLNQQELGKSIKYPVVFGNNYIEYFGQAASLPTIVLLDRNGNVVGKHEGTAPAGALEHAIETIL
jgi:thiol-disulfide isomerase/thioredoxin